MLNSLVRQAPCEKPSSMIWCDSNPWPSSSLTSSSITARPDEMPGSLRSRGNMKLNGYHVPPAAAGAMYRNSWRFSTGARSGRSVANVRQLGFDLRTVRLLPRRKLEAASELSDGLVHREARLHGRDL